MERWKKTLLGYEQMCWLHNLKDSKSWKHNLSWKEKGIIQKVLDKGWYNNRIELTKLRYIAERYEKYCLTDRKKYEVSLVDWE